MIHIKNIQCIDGQKEVKIASDNSSEIDGGGLLLMPALIDTHVHFRVPGMEAKTNWEIASRAAVRGGVTTVFDMPNVIPATVTKKALDAKIAMIDQQLKHSGIPLHYHLHFGADREHFDEIEKVKDQIRSIKIFMASSTGSLLLADDESLNRAFEIAARFGLVVAVHAEDNALVIANEEKYRGRTEFKTHSEIRNVEAAVKGSEKAIALAEKHGCRLHILHVTTKEEIPIIEAAKKKGIDVFAETSPHHMFLYDDAYETMGSLAQVNPPIRSRENAEGIVEGVRRGVIDTIGSDHAPHTLEEKMQPYGKAPSGISGIETMLPLLMTHFSPKEVQRLCVENPRKIYNLKPNDDWVLVDSGCEKTVSDSMILSNPGRTPFAGMKLKGWPKMVICQGKVFEL